MPLTFLPSCFKLCLIKRDSDPTTRKAMRGLGSFGSDDLSSNPEKPGAPPKPNREGLAPFRRITKPPIGRFFCLYTMAENLRPTVTDTSAGTGRDSGRVNRTTLTVGRTTFPDWRETADFPIDDPWSRHTRGAITVVRAMGGFRGDYTEAGIGDVRNAVAAGAHEQAMRGSTITGIDVDGWRLDVARKNLANVGVPAANVQLHEGDVVGFLQDLPQGERIQGWGVACLPQAPGFETENHADGFDADLPSLTGVRNLELSGTPVDDFGLTLNAGFLDALRSHVAPSEFDLMLTLSDRVPEPIRHELFTATGWELVDQYPTERPVQQDPDTGVTYVFPIDDGRRFFEATETHGYVPISAEEAEERRRKSAANGGRESLNVHHHLSVSHLRPKPVEVYVA